LEALVTTLHCCHRNGEVLSTVASITCEKEDVTEGIIITVTFMGKKNISMYTMQLNTKFEKDVSVGNKLMKRPQHYDICTFVSWLKPQGS
jgi:hypothetical protein